MPSDFPGPENLLFHFFRVMKLRAANFEKSVSLCRFALISRRESLVTEQHKMFSGSNPDVNRTSTPRHTADSSSASAPCKAMRGAGPVPAGSKPWLFPQSDPLAALQQIFSLNVQICGVSPCSFIQKAVLRERTGARAVPPARWSDDRMQGFFGLGYLETAPRKSN